MTSEAKLSVEDIAPELVDCCLQYVIQTSDGDGRPTDKLLQERTKRISATVLKDAMLKRVQTLTDEFVDYCVGETWGYKGGGGVITVEGLKEKARLIPPGIIQGTILENNILHHILADREDNCNITPEMLNTF